LPQGKKGPTASHRIRLGGAKKSCDGFYLGAALKKKKQVGRFSTEPQKTKEERESGIDRPETGGREPRQENRRETIHPQKYPLEKEKPLIYLPYIREIDVRRTGWAEKRAREVIVREGKVDVIANLFDGEGSLVVGNGRRRRLEANLWRVCKKKKDFLDGGAVRHVGSFLGLSKTSRRETTSPGTGPKEKKENPNQSGGMGYIMGKKRRSRKKDPALYFYSHGLRAGRGGGLYSSILFAWEADTKKALAINRLRKKSPPGVRRPLKREHYLRDESIGKDT